MPLKVSDLAQDLMVLLPGSLDDHLPHFIMDLAINTLDSHLSCRGLRVIPGKFHLRSMVVIQECNLLGNLRSALVLE
ncbi:hypothetical protein HDU97_006410 [Phlyctochytrium planicorne]|nr:hypothetical protein HDU97_006410 [Phlyctochytrium planicorne]